MIWGLDIPIKEKKFFLKIKNIYNKFAFEENTPIKFIKTNTRECINEAVLTRDYSRFLMDYSWWGGFSYGLITLGLCPPLTSTEKLGAILTGSSVHPRYKYPWGWTFFCFKIS